MKSLHTFFPTSLAIFLWLLMALSCGEKGNNRLSDAGYGGVAYSTVMQVIPGRIQCEFFDLGGEGIAYHDSDSMNRGSGGLNKGADYLSAFRVTEAVDISFTKFHNNADNSVYNLVQPEENQLYVGWTEPGEWIKYTIDVKTEGTYQVGIMYTANALGQISLSVNDQDVSNALTIPSTYHDADTIKWRQWHHWNYLPNIGEVRLTTGTQVLTLHTVTKGQMNYDYLDFKLK